jgi:hypothetical protein
MRFLSILAACSMAATLTAQSPLSLPFNSNNGLGVNSGVFFDLNVTDPAGITLLGLDVNSSSTAGTAGSVEVYTTPTTYVGSQTVAANWTLASSGGCTSAGTNNPASVCLGSPVFLAQGSHGIFLRHVGIALRYTNSAGTVTASTAEVTFSGGQSATSATLFTSTPINNRIFNGNIYYAVGPSAGSPCANKVTFGQGCYAGADSWYEAFAQLTNVDLAGTAGNETVLVATPIGPAGYLVAAGAPAWYAPTGTQILSNTATPAALGDDTMSGPQTLPFGFSFPGAAAPVTVMHANVNGYIHLGPTTLTGGDFTPTAPELHNLQPRLFPLWGDWQAATNVSTNPASGVYFDVDPSGNTVYFTWLDVADRRGQVPAAGTTTVNFQVAIHNTGVYEFRYRDWTPAATGNGAVIVGFSKGNLNVTGGPTSVDLGPRDLTAAIPFATTGPDSRSLALDSNFPRLGTNWNLTTTNVDPISPIAITFFGTAPVNPGIDLGFLGAPGCNAHINAIIADLTGAVAAGSATVTIAIPNDPTIAGTQLVGQSVCLTLKNPLALLTSNGVDALIGQ